MVVYTCVMCPKNAPEKCIGKDTDGRKCGDHCNCPAHKSAERRKRAGPSSGHRSEGKHQRRQNVEAAYVTLREAAAWLSHFESGELAHAGLMSHAALRRALYECAAKTLQEGSQIDLLSPTTGLTDVLLDALPVHMQARLLWEVSRRERQPAGAAHAATSSSQASSSSSRPPPPPPSQPAPASAPAPPCLQHEPETLPFAEQDVVWIDPPPVMVESATFANMDGALADSAWSAWASVTLNWPWRGRVSSDLRFRPGGRFLWNTPSDKPAPQIRRTIGTCPVLCVQCGKQDALWEFLQTGAPTGPLANDINLQAVVDTFMQWLAARPRMAARIHSIELAKRPNQGWVLGRWLRFNLMDRADRWNGERRTGWHATSMYSLHRAVVSGMENGMARLTTQSGAQIFEGVFCHATERMHLCQHYALYTPLDASGFYFAPLLELTFPASDPRRYVVPRTKKSQTQWLTYEDIVAIRCVWINIFHIAEVTQHSRDNWVHVEGKFFPELELDPDDSRDVIARRSRELQDVLP